jgi:hypothetical protein
MNDEELKKLLERIATALEKQNTRREEFDAKLSQAIDQITNMMSLLPEVVLSHVVGGHQS